MTRRQWPRHRRLEENPRGNWLRVSFNSAISSGRGKGKGEGDPGDIAQRPSRPNTVQPSEINGAEIEEEKGGGKPHLRVPRLRHAVSCARVEGTDVIK